MIQRLIVLLFFSGFCFSCTSSHIKNEDSTTYYDENNKEISSKKINQLLSEYKSFEIPGNTSSERKLINRKQQGKIDQCENYSSYFGEFSKDNMIKSLKKIVRNQ